MSDSSESTLQLALTILQSNYVTVAILTAVGYDYVLSFSNEVEYVWSKPWTAVSTLFVLVRYVGLCDFMVSAVGQSGFILGPEKVFVHPTFLINKHTESGLNLQTRFPGKILYVFNRWIFILFLGPADAVMILRVWVMCNRSRLVLITLLILFSLEMISNVLAIAVDSGPNKLLVTKLQISDFSRCTVHVVEPVWRSVAVASQIAQSAVACLLAVIQVTRESFRMYRVTKRWKPNVYLRLLVKQGILTFFAFFLFGLIDVLLPSTMGWLAILLVILEYVPIFTLTPRFILCIRALYARDIEGIDTGFGLSTSGFGMTTIAFADPRQLEGWEDAEEVSTEAETTPVVQRRYGSTLAFSTSY